MNKNRFIKILIWIILTIVVNFVICLFYGAFPKYYPFNGLIFAISFHFLLMGWISFVMNLFKIKESKNRYFELQPFEKNGKIYKYIGINLFKKILVFIGWEKIINMTNPKVNLNYNNLLEREKNTRSGELGHLIIFFNVIILIPILTNSLYDAKWLLITNIILHFYPVCLQRHNRPRYLSVLGKMRKQTICIIE